mmetsp:Transcript_43306/g.36309  ORF Transcript_43306/g.36309 Transcript_43306/m.36309 type:complete len:85 (-) Transcript_43306:1470-1724(-)
MNWWNDLWLNESFATFIGNLAIDKLHPEFNHSENFVSDTMIQALELDGLSSSHPISVEINRVQEANEIFDAISYKKGCSVLRMF